VYGASFGAGGADPIRGVRFPSRSVRSEIKGGDPPVSTAQLRSTAQLHSCDDVEHEEWWKARSFDRLARRRHSR
jgi:hypothetical protein